MDERYTRISVPLGRDEFIALRESATGSYRHPRDQARYLLRLALGLAAATNEPNKHNHAVHTLPGNDGVIATA